MSTVATGDKGLLQGTHRRFQGTYVALELEIRIPDHILFYDIAQ